MALLQTDGEHVLGVAGVEDVAGLAWPLLEVGKHGRVDEEADTTTGALVVPEMIMGVWVVC